MGEGICTQVKPQPDETPGGGPDLTAADILNANDTDIKAMDVPEWGGRVYLRTISGAERDEYAMTCANRTQGSKVNIRELEALLLVMAICDIDGNPLFNKSHVKELDRKSSKVVDRLLQAIQQHNRMDDESVEELAGN